MQTIPQFDTAVIGAGLAGLVAACQLARQGQRVLVLERQHRVGGLCGVDTDRQHYFAIACNDFGGGMIRQLQQLGLPTCFERKSSRIFYQQECFTAPLGAGFACQLMRSPVQFGKLLWGLWHHRNTAGGGQTLGQFCQRYLADGRIQDICSIPAYLMGVCPDDFALAYLGYEKSFGYDYNNPGVPVGGPQQLVDDLLDLCQQLQVQIHTGVNIAQPQPHAGGYLLETGGREWQCDTIVDTRPRQDAYPADVKEGMPLCQLRLWLSPGFTSLDPAIHTYLYYPAGGGAVMKALDQGLWQSDFPFHFFCNHYPQPGGQLALSLYFYLPRGVLELTTEQQRELASLLLAKADLMLPGMAAAVQHWSFLTPAAFAAKFQCLPRVMPYIWHGEKPSQLSTQRNYFYAGHTVYPLGDHAAAAVLSALSLSQRLTQTKGIRDGSC